MAEGRTRRVNRSDNLTHREMSSQHPHLGAAAYDLISGEPGISFIVDTLTLTRIKLDEVVISATEYSQSAKRGFLFASVTAVSFLSSSLAF